MENATIFTAPYTGKSVFCFPSEPNIHERPEYEKIQILCQYAYSKKYVRMIRKYHNHTLQTNPRHCEEEPHNIYNSITSVRQ